MPRPELLKRDTCCDTPFIRIIIVIIIIIIITMTVTTIIIVTTIIVTTIIIATVIINVIITIIISLMPTISTNLLLLYPQHHRHQHHHHHQHFAFLSSLCWPASLNRNQQTAMHVFEPRLFEESHFGYSVASAEQRGRNFGKKTRPLCFGDVIIEALPTRRSLAARGDEC